MRAIGRSCISWVVVMGACAPAHALIGVELRAVAAQANVGEQVRIGVFALAEDGPVELFSAVQVILAWSPAHLRLAGVSQSGATPLLASGFPSPDAFGLNETNPPQDGLGLYVAFAPLGNPSPAIPAGTLLTTLLFEALSPTPGTSVSIIDHAGSPEGSTVVYDGLVPNRDVTGVLGGPVNIVIPAPAGAFVVGVAGCAACGRRRS